MKENIVNKFSYAKTLAQEKEVQKYLIKSRIYTISTISITLLISYFLGTIKLTAITGFTASLWRGFSGGAHTKSLNVCSIISIIIFNVLSLVNIYLQNNINNNMLFWFSVMIMISGLYMIINYVPIDSENRPILDLKFKKQLKLCSLIFFIAVLFLVYFVDNLGYKLAFLFGLSWQLFTMTKPCYHLFSKL